MFIFLYSRYAASSVRKPPTTRAKEEPIPVVMDLLFCGILDISFFFVFFLFSFSFSFYVLNYIMFPEVILSIHSFHYL